MDWIDFGTQLTFILIICFVTIILHELFHYFAMKHYGGDAKFVLTFKQRSMKIFPTMGVKTNYEPNSMSQVNWILLSPIPVTFIGWLLLFYVGFGNDFYEYFGLNYYFLIIPSLVMTWSVCSSDIKLYKKYRMTLKFK